MRFDDVADPTPFVLRQSSRISIIAVGAGGTGSWLIGHLARLVWVFNRKEEHFIEKRSASLLIIDHDTVEEKNVTSRQNFCPPEIGYPKAQVLSNRMALAFAMGSHEIGARVAPFSASMVRSLADTIILVGCVDNAQVRAEMALTLSFNDVAQPRITYIDAGNGDSWGQIFVGNTASVEDLKGCLHDPICTRLPSPALLAPSMFVVEKVEKSKTRLALSCGDMEISSEQGRTINNHMASLIYAYVERLMYGSITTFATWTNLSAIETHSASLTPQALSHALGKEPAFFTVHLDDEE